MRCQSCNQKVPRQSRYCNHCGHVISEPSSAPRIPEGFVFDRVSGWYHKIELNRRKDGRFLQEITYYNPKKEWFLQELPSNHTSYHTSDEGAPAPIGEVSDYLYDELQELYYLTDTLVDDKNGDVIQRVSYYYPEENKFININYRILPKEKEPALPVNSEVHSIEGIGTELAKESEEALSKGRKNKKRWSNLWKTIAAVLAACSLGLAIYYGLVFGGIIPQGTLEATVSNWGETAKTVPQKIQRLFEKKEKVWPDFPQVSSSYKSAQQEGDTLFFLGTTEQKTAALYAFDTKSNHYEILVESPDTIHRLGSFAVTPEYIYYSIAKEQDSEAKYYRLNRSSGVFEFLFTTDTSSIFTDGEFLYLLLPSNNRLRKLPVESQNVRGYTEFTIPLASDAAYLLSNNFSVIDQWLYYSEFTDKTYRYFRLHLETKESEELLPNIAQKGLIYNPFWLKGDSYYTEIQESEELLSLYRMNEQGSVRLLKLPSAYSQKDTPYFATILGDNIIYSYGADTKIASISKQESTTISDKSAVAVTPQWLVLDNALYHIDKGELFEVNSEQAQKAEAVPATAVEIEQKERMEHMLGEELFQLVGQMACASGEQILAPIDFMNYLGYIISAKPKLPLLRENEVDSDRLSTLLWELYSLDYKTFKTAVERSEIEGFYFEEERLFFEESSLKELPAITIESVESTSENTVMLVVSSEDGTAYEITLEQNTIYSLSQYRILQAKKS